RDIFESVMNGATNAARWLDARLNPWPLQTQLRILLVVTLLAGVLAALYRTSMIDLADFRLSQVDPVFVVLWILGCGCALGAAYQAKFHRLAAVVMMGGAGLVSCLTFIWLSAPDLALTQLLVEIVTTALLLLGLRWLPKRVRDLSGFTPASRRRATLRRGIDMTIAIVCGLSVAVAVFVVMATAAPDSISRYFLERSYSDAG